MTPQEEVSALMGELAKQTTLADMRQKELLEANNELLQRARDAELQARIATAANAALVKVLGEFAIRVDDAEAKAVDPVPVSQFRETVLQYMQLAHDQYMGCGGNLTDREVVHCMQSTLRIAMDVVRNINLTTEEIPT